MISRPVRRTCSLLSSTILIAAATFLLVASPQFAATAHAAGDAEIPEDIQFGDECVKLPERQDGVHTRMPASTDVTGGYAVFPPRLELEVQPGEAFEICIGFQNRAGRPVKVAVRGDDIEDSGDPIGPIQITRAAADFGAGDWLSFPIDEPLTIEHGEIIWLEVAVDVPTDALAGSNYGAVVWEQVTGTSSGSGVSAEVLPNISTQVFFDVPGDVGRTGKLDKTESPGVVWWDGVDLARFGPLERLRGLGFAPIKLWWRNTGELSDEISGRVVVRSFTGKTVKSIPIRGGIVLRGGTRRFDVDWRDPPIFGRFTPTVEIVDRNGNKITKKLDPIWVIPAWWYIILVVLAIVVPTVITWRRRRRMHALMARLDAAEARAAAGDSDADDESSEGWDP